VLAADVTSRFHHLLEVALESHDTGDADDDLELLS